MTRPISAIAGCASAPPAASRSRSRMCRKADVDWETEPDWYASSPIASRPYCRECGTSLGFAFPGQREHGPDHRRRSTIPSRFRPKHHFGVGEHAPRLARHRRPARISHRRAIKPLARTLDRRPLASSPTRQRILPLPTAAELAWHEMGEGRPVVLLHGLFSDADINWIKFGHAAALADAGLPGDHARSARPWRQRQAARSGFLSAGRAGRRRLSR